MAPLCRKSKKKEKAKKEKVHSSTSSLEDHQLYYNTGEGEDYEKEIEETKPEKAPIESLRDWLQKQKFIPQDLKDDFLNFFLSVAGHDAELAAKKLEKYFYARQEPSQLFGDRDPLSCPNYKIFNTLYVLPMPETTEDGKKVILTGLIKPTTSYNQMDHAKALVMVLDLLLWEKDLGSGDFVIVLDGRGFQCPQLLENKVPNHRTIKTLLQDAIPGTLTSFYLLYPPPHLANVADSRNGIWIKVVNTTQEMVDHLPADILPLEFGGNLGPLEDILERWETHMIQSQNFFINFEKTMIHLYEMRTCYEKEVKNRGKNWVQNMKLVADEWEYKIQYYNKINQVLNLKHPAFGKGRTAQKPKEKPGKDPLAECRLKAKEEEESTKVLQSLRPIKEPPPPEAEETTCHAPILELGVYYL